MQKADTNIRVLYTQSNYFDASSLLNTIKKSFHGSNVNHSEQLLQLSLLLSLPQKPGKYQQLRQGSQLSTSFNFNGWSRCFEDSMFTTALSHFPLHSPGLLADLVPWAAAGFAAI